MEYEKYMKNNSSLVTVIILSGFHDLQNLSIFLFLILLLIYCVTVCGNLLIILVVSYSRSLHSPMYFFLTQLSFSDILLSTTIVPNMLHVLLYGSSMSFIGCLIQYYFFSASGILDTLLLTVMSYDRYQAICNPLHYSMVMNPTFCIRALILFWLIIFAVILVTSATMSQLQFCGPNIIDHFYCERDSILELSCSDTFIIEAESMFLMIPLVVCPFIVIIVSYVYITITILKIPSVTSRQKTFSTCSSHLAVVSTLYGSSISIYLFPYKGMAKKFVSLFCTIVAPLLNPIIYSLNNRDINRACKNLLRKINAELQMCFPIWM